MKSISSAEQTFVKSARGKGFNQTAVTQYEKDMQNALDQLNAAFRRLEDAKPKFKDINDRGLGPVVVAGFAMGGVILILFTGVLGIRFHQAWRYGDVLGLRNRSEEEIQRLQFELTESQGGTLNLPIIARVGATLSRSRQRRTRDLTLPAITAQYVEYIKDVQRVLREGYGSEKLIICIDELDKITDPKQVGNVLREIKGGLYLENCFYLLSISEDAVRAFQSRLVEQRDIFESTFDEILFLERLDLETCVKIAEVRCGIESDGSGADESPQLREALEIAAALSSGVPRELLRNLRAIANDAGHILKATSAVAWCTLFRRKLRDIQKKVRTSDGLNEMRADILDELASFWANSAGSCDDAAVAEALSKVRGTRKRLKERTEEHDRLAAEADQEFRAQTLRQESELLRSWSRYWMELEIQLLIRQCSLESQETSEVENRRASYARILGIYGGLPYSMEVTARRLEDFCAPPSKEAAE